MLEHLDTLGVAYPKDTSRLPTGNTRRAIDFHTDGQLDEAPLADWVKQASLLPGERM